jgi:hypothetical protein
VLVAEVHRTPRGVRQRDGEAVALARLEGELATQPLQHICRPCPRRDHDACAVDLVVGQAHAGEGITAAAEAGDCAVLEKPNPLLGKGFRQRSRERLRVEQPLPLDDVAVPDVGAERGIEGPCPLAAQRRLGHGVDTPRELSLSAQGGLRLVP